MLELTFITRNIVFPQNNLDDNDVDDVGRHVNVLNNHIEVDNNVLLSPHGQRWVNCGEPMTIDANLCHAYVLPTAINITDQNVHGQEYRAIDYFYAMFPMHFFIAKMLQYTNQEFLVKRRAVTN